MGDESKRYFRVTQNGVSVNVLAGYRDDARGQRVPISGATIASEGKVIDNLAPYLIEAYDNNDPTVRAVLVEVQEDGATSVNNPAAEALSVDYAEQQVENDRLRAEVNRLAEALEAASSELTQAQTEIQASSDGNADLQARVTELEGQLAEAQAASDSPPADAPDEFASLEGDALAEAGKAANYPKLGDSNWSTLDDDQKREALRQAAGGGAPAA